MGSFAQKSTGGMDAVNAGLCAADGEDGYPRVLSDLPKYLWRFCDHRTNTAGKGKLRFRLQ